MASHAAAVTARPARCAQVAAVFQYLAGRAYDGGQQDPVVWQAKLPRKFLPKAR
jgi:hypothetical protein